MNSIEKIDVTHHAKNGWYMEVLFIIDVCYNAEKNILSHEKSQEQINKKVKL